MKPAPFDYVCPTTVEETCEHLANNGDAKLLAGGQSLIPTMNFRLAQPAMLIDLNGIEGLSYIERDGGEGIRIGAMTRQRTVERSADVRECAPLVSEAMAFVAHPQIRNRGTFGGSVAHADPAAEVPAVMLALDAVFRVRGPNGERTVAAGDFFTGLFTTALAPGEVLVEIAIPRQPPNAGWAFEEIARRHGDYALVGVAAVVTLDGDQRCSGARIALLSVGDGPVRAEVGEGVLVGQALGPEVIRDAADAVASQDIDPPGDIHASAAYRRHLAAVLTSRALTRAIERVKVEGE